jgi:hypothetical protein
MPTTPEEADTLFGLTPLPRTEAPGAGPATGTFTGTALASQGPPPGLAPTVAPTAGFDMPPPESLEGLPTIRLENRREQRYKVSWPGRVQLPNGRVVDVRVRDLSPSGLGLLTPVAIPASVTINFAMGVPGLNDPANITAISGKVLTAYSVLQGSDIQCGGTWVQLPPEGRDLIDQWIRRLKR